LDGLLTDASTYGGLVAQSVRVWELAVEWSRRYLILDWRSSDGTVFLEFRVPIGFTDPAGGPVPDRGLSPIPYPCLFMDGVVHGPDLTRLVGLDPEGRSTWDKAYTLDECRIASFRDWPVWRSDAADLLEELAEHMLSRPVRPQSLP
jgi:hypothetical protein